MVNLIVKVYVQELKPLYQSIFLALSENLRTIYWIDFYNINSLIDSLKSRKFTDYWNVKTNQMITIKININQYESYRKLMLKRSIIWEDPYLTMLHRKIIADLDKRTLELKEIIVEN